MLSILIPTYNYNVLPLVKEVHSQALTCNIPFEILVYDDGSNSSINNENKHINNLSNCTFKVLSKNIGRSAIRNKLADQAIYDWILFLDADVMPKKKDLILRYLNMINQGYEIVYGGIEYQEKQPKKDKILRWKYGIKREALNAKVRNKDKYLRFLTLNFLIKKKIFNEVSFNEDIPNLRHEDTLFGLELQKRQVTLFHIDNPVIHLGIENSEVFLQKSLQSVKALDIFMDNGLIEPKNTLITRTYSVISRYKLRPTIAWFFEKLKHVLVRQILSAKPNLFIFDLYRLGYLCSLKNKH